MKKPPQPAASLFEGEDLSTGTYGPLPQSAPKTLEVVKPVFGQPGPKKAPPIASAARQTPPYRVGYKTALHQITGTVLDLLKARGEQWTHDAKQDLISTVFIAAAREKRIAFDFEPEEK